MNLFERSTPKRHTEELFAGKNRADSPSYPIVIFVVLIDLSTVAALRPGFARVKRVSYSYGKSMTRFFNRVNISVNITF